MKPPQNVPAPADETETGTDPEAFAGFVFSIMEEKRAQDVVWLDVSELTDLADYFLIATIFNQPQGGAILDACEKEAKRRGVRRVGIEGETGSSWILIDYGDLIVHLFLPEQRAYYALEHVWGDARTVKRSEAQR